MYEKPLPSIETSLRIYERSVGLIPAHTQTLAKGPEQHVFGVAPVYAKRGAGGHIWDVDGNEYIDLTMGVGPISIGYAEPSIDTAIRNQLQDGITFSLMHPLEVEVAEMIRSIVPYAESVRFSKTGCDVTSAAVRLARAFTGKSTIVCCGYHGWHDWYISVTDRSAGIPDQVRDKTYTFNYNDFDSVLAAVDDDTAAIILEPVVFDEPHDEFLHRLRTLCDERGILLIFDEMWTGFRFALGGAQEYFGVRADLACFSKAVANGMPLSVLCGRSDVMRLLEQDVFFFTTFGGEALSLAAAKATLEFMKESDVVGRLESVGTALRDGFNDRAKNLGLDYAAAKGFGCRSMVVFDASAGNPLLMKSFVQQEMIRRGVLWGGFHNVCFRHSEQDITTILAAYGEVLPLLDSHVSAGTLESAIQGRPVRSVFRKTSNFNTKPRTAEVVE